MADGLAVEDGEKKTYQKVPRIRMFMESCHLRIERELRMWVVVPLYTT